MTKPYLVHSSDTFEVLSAFYPESFVAVSTTYRLFGSFEKNLRTRKLKPLENSRFRQNLEYMYIDPNKGKYTVMAV